MMMEECFPSFQEPQARGYLSSIAEQLLRLRKTNHKGKNGKALL
jgi:hypothetical protein